MLLRLLQNDIRTQQQLLFDYNWGPTDIYGIHLDFNSKKKKSSRLGCQLVGNVYSKSWFSTLFCPFSLVFPFNNFSTASRRRRKSQILPSWTSIASGRQMATHLSRLHHHHHLSFQFGQTTRLWLQSIFVEKSNRNTPRKKTIQPKMGQNSPVALAKKTKLITSANKM